MDLTVADRILDMRTTFQDLVHLHGFNAVLSEEALRAAGCQNLEADFDQQFDGRQDACLVVIADRDEDGAFTREFHASTQWCANCRASVSVNTSSFPSWKV